MLIRRVSAFFGALVASAFAVVAIGTAAIATPAPAPNTAATSWTFTPATETGADGRRWVETSADAGASIRDHAALHNLSDTPITFQLSGADGYFTNTGRYAVKTRDEPSTGAGAWVHPDVSEVTVLAGETAIVPFTVVVPEHATPGDHAAGLVSSVFSRGDGSGAAVGLDTRVAFRVMVHVNGEVAPAATLSTISASYNTQWNPFRPGTIDVQYALKNTGNVWLALDGTAKAAGQSGSAPLKNRQLLAGESATVRDTVRQVWPFGPRTVEVTITGTPSVAAGSAVAGKTVTVTKQVTVWAMPWPQLLVALGVLLVVGALMFRRKRSKRKLDRLLEEARQEGAREAQANSAAEH